MTSFAEKNYVRIIEMFLKNGANPNIITSGDTPLKSAVYTENIKLVEILLDNGADPNFFPENEYSPLNLACETLNLEIIKLLLERGANPNDNDDETNLLWIFENEEASSEQKFAATKLLLEYGYDITSKNEYGYFPTEIFTLIRDDDNIEILKLLIEYGLDLNNYTDDKYHGKLLNIPSEKGQIETLKFLLENGIDPNISKDALINAIENDNMNNNIEIVRLLLDNGADPNVQNGDNDTPLMKAMDKQNLPIMILLLDRGADPHFVWQDPYRPDIKLNMIQFARRHRYNIALQLLESYISEKNKMQNTEQRLATGMALNPRLGQDSVFGYIDEPGIFEKIASHIPEYNSRYAPDVSRRMMLENKQIGQGKHGKKLSKRKIRNNYRFY
jgi:ankyrin repeat protein